MLLQSHKNPLKDSTGQKTHYYVGVVKDKRTGKNGLEFLIGWCKTAAALQSGIDRRSAAHKKNVKSVRDRNTATDIAKAGADGDDDDEEGKSEEGESEHENEDGEGGGGQRTQLQKRRQARSF